MGRRGLTLVELVVVIVILALVTSILISVLARRRQLAFRTSCANNLGRIGIHMLIYAGDWESAFPHAGSRTAVWGPVVWNAASRDAAYGITDTNHTGGNASITASLFLLMKYQDMIPGSFVCPRDVGTTEWVLSEETAAHRPASMVDCWDFGANPQSKVSYAYHTPFRTFGVSTRSQPGFAVAADRNPWMEAPGRSARPFPGPFNGKAGSTDDQMYGNSTIHQRDGQNVLFADSHVDFSGRPFCSFGDDNIYTRSTIPDKGDPFGTAPIYDPSLVPMHKKDSLLVQDPVTWTTGSTTAAP